MRIKEIFSPRIARKLITAGFKVVDIRPNDEKMAWLCCLLPLSQKLFVWFDVFFVKKQPYAEPTKPVLNIVAKIRECRPDDID